MNFTVLSLLTKLLFANSLCLNAAAPKFTRVSWCTKQDNSQKKLELFCFVELEGLILFPVLVNHTNNALCISKVCIFICRTPLQAMLVGVLQIKMPQPYGWGIDLWSWRDLYNTLTTLIFKYLKIEIYSDTRIYPLLKLIIST